MRKKDIIQLNAQLFEKAERLQLANEELRLENVGLKAKIEQLTLKIDKRASQTSNTEIPEAIQENMDVVTVDKPTELGSQIIGKIIVSATQYCNQITAGNTENSKELVNLILGRTEVAKAEILQIVENTELSIELVNELSLQEQASAEDYFKSVLAQID